MAELHPHDLEPGATCGLASITKAAAATGMSRAHLRYFIRRGRLQVVGVEGLAKLVRLSDVQALADNRRKRYPAVAEGETPYKNCSACGTLLPATPEWFGPHPSGAYGVRPDCRSCVNEGKRQSETAREYRKRRYQENGQEMRARWLAWADANREMLRAAGRDHYWENRDAILAQRRADYAANPGPERERRRVYTAKNPDAARDRVQRRRARLLQAPLIEKIDREYIYNRDGGRCHICEKKVSAKAYTLDHLVPLSKGGEHSHANLKVAHLSCNSSRGAGRLPAQLLLIA